MTVDLPRDIVIERRRAIIARIRADVAELRYLEAEYGFRPATIDLRAVLDGRGPVGPLREGACTDGASVVP